MESFGEKTLPVQLTPLGEFVDRRLEKEYAQFEAKSSVELTRRVALLLGALYFMSIIADYAVISGGQLFNRLLLNRVLFLTVSILFNFWLKNNKEQKKYYLGITAYGIVGTAFLTSIFFKYDASILFIQSLDTLLLLLVINILPNKWIYTVVVTAINISLYIFFTIINAMGSTYNHALPAVHIVPVAVVFILASCYLNRYRRHQYVYHKSLIRMSTRDALTGIYNRYGFEEELQRSVSHAGRYGTQLSLILFDIDNFKAINDKFGHLIGDKVLIRFTEIIGTEIRECDFFSRWGGEEFALILPGTNKDDAFMLANRLRSKVCNTYISPAGCITCSFGIDSMKAGDSAESLFSRVDSLMYLAKVSGKDQVVNEVRL